MTELQPSGQATKPLTAAQAQARDEMSLKGLTSLINSPEFHEGSMEGDSGKFSAPPSETPNVAELKPRAVLAAPVVAPAAPEKEIVYPSKVYTTGRLNAGKDTFLTAIGRTIHGFADPLYAIQKLFFGTDDKKAPGARAFLQAVGQWGRGTVSDKYPLTPGRAVFTTLIRAMGAQVGFDVQWDGYGMTDALWVNALLARTEGLDNIGVSNVRFKNEREALNAAGFTHFHVMASRQTLINRWKAAGIPENSPTLTDVSEQMAIALDNAAMDLVRKSPVGPKLRVVWSDKQVKSPSPRFITL